MDREFLTGRMRQMATLPRCPPKAFFALLFAFTIYQSNLTKSLKIS